MFRAGPLVVWARVSIVCYEKPSKRVWRKPTEGRRSTGIHRRRWRDDLEAALQKNGRSQKMMQRTGTTGQNPYMAPAPDTKEMATEDRRWWIQLSIVWTARHSDKDSPDCNRTASCPWPRRGSRGAGG